RTSIELAELIGGRLADIEEATAVLRVGRYFEPTKVTYASGPNAGRTSMTDLAIAMHSHALGELAPDLWCNEGKWWLRGASPGRALNFGRRDDTLPAHRQIATGVRGWQGPAQAHFDSHTDCSQTLRVVREGALPETPRVPLGLLALSLGLTQLGVAERPGTD